MSQTQRSLVRVHNLSKRFGRTLAVDGVGFELFKGEVFGLLGPNGAGKTTTIAMLTGLIQPTEGRIIIDGRDLSTGSSHVKSLIGLVPQDFAFYPSLTAEENLAFFGRLYGMRGRALTVRMQLVLEAVHLQERAAQRVVTFSNGMKRRLNFAIGLLHEPRILFMDEPTVGVDPQSRNAIFDAVEALGKRGVTILYTTHYMEEAQRLCHRVAIMDQGRMMAMDNPLALVQRLGGGFIEMTLAQGARRWEANLFEGLPSVLTVGVQEKRLQLETQDVEKTLRALLHVTQENHIAIETLNVLDSNLESVFLNLTGKHLRD
jgi:ABC-2 type transport system ATP-binding protein